MGVGQGGQYEKAWDALGKNINQWHTVVNGPLLLRQTSTCTYLLQGLPSPNYLQKHQQLCSQEC